MPHYQHSYRSGIGGQLYIAVFVDGIQLHTGKFILKIFCDGLLAINRVDINEEYIRCSREYVDIVSLIFDLWNRSECSMNKDHAYGYHVDICELLTMLEHINYRMDTLYKSIDRSHTQSNNN